MPGLSRLSLVVPVPGLVVVGLWSARRGARLSGLTSYAPQGVGFGVSIHAPVGATRLDGRPSQQLPVDGGGDAEVGEAAAELVVGLALAVHDVGQLRRVAANPLRHVRNPAATPPRRHPECSAFFRLRCHLLLVLVGSLCYLFSLLVLTTRPNHYRCSNESRTNEELFGAVGRMQEWHVGVGFFQIPWAQSKDIGFVYQRPAETIRGTYRGGLL